LQALELLYAMGKVHPLEQSVPSSTAAQVGSLFSPAPWARFNDAVMYNEAIEVDKNNDDEEMEEDDDDQIIPPHPTKNPPVSSAPRDPSKKCPPAIEDKAGGRHPLDGDH
jgi:hypothetical protein